MCKKSYLFRFLLLFILVSSLNVTAQEFKIGLIPGSGNESGDEEEAFKSAGIVYEVIDGNGYTIENLSQYNVIGVDVIAYDGNADLKANYSIVNQYVHDGGYLVTLDYQQDSTWKTQYLPYPLTLHDDDITNSREAKLYEHPLLNWPNKITVDNFKDGLWGQYGYFADGPHEAGSQWDVIVEDVEST